MGGGDCSRPTFFPSNNPVEEPSALARCALQKSTNSAWLGEFFRQPRAVGTLIAEYSLETRCTAVCADSAKAMCQRLIGLKREVHAESGSSSTHASVMGGTLKPGSARW